MGSQSGGRTVLASKNRSIRSLTCSPVRACKASGIINTIMECTGPGHQVETGRVCGPHTTHRPGMGMYSPTTPSAATAAGLDKHWLLPLNHQLRLHIGEAGKWLTRCASVCSAPSVLRTMLARTQADNDARGCHSVPLGHRAGSNAIVLVLGLAMARSVRVAHHVAIVQYTSPMGTTQCPT